MTGSRAEERFLVRIVATCAIGLCATWLVIPFACWMAS